MLRIGLTGGIGSGKSTVAQFFADLGAPIIDADKIAFDLTLPHTNSFQQIKEHFGNDIILNNQLDREKLRKKIFENPNEKKWLEQLLHPLIIEKMIQQLNYCHFNYCILVIPLLTESEKINFIDRILVVDAPVELQIKRAKKRDRASQEEIERIINSQKDRKARLSMADDIIINDADLEGLKKKVENLHEFYLKLSK